MTPPETKPRNQSATILVVEDEPVLLDLARLILESCGHRVLCAGSRTEAIEQWRQARGEVDLLLADMLLKEGRSGRELADLFITEKSDLKIIFTSALASGEFITDLNDHGARFLQKPYTKLILANAVRECLQD